MDVLQEILHGLSMAFTYIVSNDGLDGIGGQYEVSTSKVAQITEELSVLSFRIPSYRNCAPLPCVSPFEGRKGHFKRFIDT
jgi:hypothetical protein